MGIRNLFVFVALICCSAPSSCAQVGGLGTVSFANSGSPEAQETFARGILLLHSFEYEDAREAFTEARTIDPEFAMAYWGEAMTWNHPIWMIQKTEQGQSVLMELAPDLDGRLEKAPTEREKEYIRAIDALYFGEGGKEARDFAYESQMAGLSANFPDDLEAAAFHALSILGLAHDGRDFALYMRAAAIVEKVFAENPQHPGAAHYLIHAYDDPIHAPLGLRAARVYAEIAPEAAHALHMPSHIFAALGMWPEMESANQASFLASDARMHRKGLGVEARSFHARHWLAYAYLQQGRYAEAEQLVQDMLADVSEGGDSKFIRGYAVRILVDYLVETENWVSEYADVKFPADDLRPPSRANLYFMSGKVALANNDEQGARQALKLLMDLENKDEEGQLLQHQLKADLLILEGNLKGAIELLTTAAEMDSERPLDYGPPKPAKPTHERLGELHLLASNGEDAMQAFEASLARASGRTQSLLGLSNAAKMSGDMETYQNAISRVKEIWKVADANVAKSLSASENL